MTEPTPKLTRLAQASVAFSPSAPVDNMSLFSDRPEQLMACIGAFFQKGRHVALYGERGVGKTSLANIVPEILNHAGDADVRGVRVDCNTMDDYNSIWRKILRELRVEIPRELDEYRTKPMDPEDIRFLLQSLSVRTLIVVDEFDRVEDDEALTLMADTVKTLSDHAVDTKLMFVGVAASVEALLGEHESILRNIEQIPMPRMSVHELEGILDRGFERIDDLTMAPDVKDRIIGAAEGLPYFVHLLGLGAAQNAVKNDRDLVTLEDVDAAEAETMQTHSLVSEYRRATHSNQPGNLFEQVLLACAYAPRDSLGCFKPGDLRFPLSIITGQEMEISRFQRHLRELHETRNTLNRIGESRHYMYSFRNPQLQPFIKMVARAKRVVDATQMGTLRAYQAEASAPSLFEPILPQQPV